MCTLKAVVDETDIRKSTIVCKSIVGKDASQLYPYSVCQSMPSALYTRHEFHADLQRLKPRQNKSRNFQNVAMLYFQRLRPPYRIESFHTTKTQKNLTVLMPMGSVHIATQCLKQWVVFIITVFVKKHDLPYVNKTFNVEQKIGKWMKFGNSVYTGKITLLSKCGNVNGGNSTGLMCQ